MNVLNCRYPARVAIKLVPVLALLLFYNLLLFGTDLKPLSVGDKVPDIYFEEMVNYNSAHARLSDFRGKAVLLDFWGTWCSACIGNFEHLDALQKTYAGKLQILLIDAKSTQDTRQMVKAFFERTAREKGHPYALPSAVGDTLADLLFTHRMIPHYVWIDENGIVKAITGPEAVTEKNVEALVNGNVSSLAQKKDLVDFSMMDPLFSGKSIHDLSTVDYRVTFLDLIPGVPFGGMGEIYDSAGGFYRIFSVNATITSIYTQAYALSSDWNENRIFINNKPAAEALLNPANSRLAKIMGAEIVCKSGDGKEAHKKMVRSLDEYYGITSKLSTRKIPCLEIVKHRKNKNDDTLDDKNAISIKSLVSDVNTYQALPIITNLPPTTRIRQLSFKDPGSSNELDSLLRANGFELKRVHKQVDILSLETIN